jgi:oligopeptide transport system substrate-binding protein
MVLGYDPGGDIMEGPVGRPDRGVAAVGLLLAGLGACGLVALVWALLSAGTVPRADFVLANGNEPESLDPALASGAPEGRVIRALFEGLVVLHPETTEPLPGAARSFRLSDDGLTWTFELQPEGRWSDGSPVVAQDFADSLLRVLDPATGARSANILFDVRGARAFARPQGATRPEGAAVGIRATSDRTLVVELERRSPAFLQILALPAFCPVKAAATRRHGSAWTRPGNLVSNGPFRLAGRTVRDRLRLVRNEHYWDRDRVLLRSLDVLAATSLTTLVNLYASGDVDWVTSVPMSLVPALRRDPAAGLRTGPLLGTYFYRVNTTHPTLRNRKIRAALSLALDRPKIVACALAGGEPPAVGLVPPGIPGWSAAILGGHDPAGARALLAEGLAEEGLPALPPFELLYNTHELHEAIAELVQLDWREHLGVTCRLARQDWAAARTAIRRLDYSVSRGVWLADYADPATFLDVFTTTSVNNQTGFSDAAFDRLVESDARRAATGAERLATLAEAERILIEAHPIIPIFHYVSYNLVKPDVAGFHDNPLDVHFPKFLARPR